MAEGVLIFQSFHEALKELPDADRLNAYDAIVRYGLYGEIIDMTPTVKILFPLMKPNIDSSKNKYQASKENGGKPPKPGSNPRGRPRKNQTENQRKNQTENQDKDKDREKDFDSDLEKEKDSFLSTPPLKSAEKPTQREKETDYEKMRQDMLRSLSKSKYGANL